MWPAILIGILFVCCIALMIVNARTNDLLDEATELLGEAIDFAETVLEDFKRSVDLIETLALQKENNNAED